MRRHPSLMFREQIDSAGILAGKVSAVGGGGAAFFFGLTANEFAALTGVCVGVLGLCVQWFYSRRKDRRETAEHDARMSSLRSGYDRPA